MSPITLEERIFSKLISPDMNKLQFIRLKFGLSLLIDSIKKGLIIYGVAHLLNCFFETLIVHIGFLFLRQVSFGWHSSNNLICIIWSIIAFPIFTFLLEINYINNNFFLFTINLFCLMFLWFNGPIGTQVNSIPNIKHRQILHLKLKKRVLIIVFLSFIVPNFIFPYIVLGVFIQTTTLLIQIIKNGVKDYDRKSKTKSFNEFEAIN